MSLSTAPNDDDGMIDASQLDRSPTRDRVAMVEFRGCTARRRPDLVVPQQGVGRMYPVRPPLLIPSNPDSLLIDPSPCPSRDLLYVHGKRWKRVRAYAFAYVKIFFESPRTAP